MKIYKTPLLVVSVGLLSSPLLEAAWIWQNWGGAANNPSGSSGSFQLTPLYAAYDNGDGSPLPYDPASGAPNDNDGYGWDQTPVDFTFSWSTTGGESVEFGQDAGFLGGNRYLDVFLDPDGNGDLPTSLTITVSFPFDLTVRGIASGALATNFNPFNMTMDGRLSASHSDGTPVVLDNTYSYGDNGAGGGGVVPSSYSSGDAIWTDITNDGWWYGLNNSGGSASHFPMVPSPDQDAALGQVSWTLSNFSGGNTFLMSFDGGVGANAQETVFIPEPTASFLLGFSALSLALRRKR